MKKNKTSSFKIFSCHVLESSKLCSTIFKYPPTKIAGKDENKLSKGSLPGFSIPKWFFSLWLARENFFLKRMQMFFLCFDCSQSQKSRASHADDLLRVKRRIQAARIACGRPSETYRTGISGAMSLGVAATRHGWERPEGCAKGRNGCGPSTALEAVAVRYTNFKRPRVPPPPARAVPVERGWRSVFASARCPQLSTAVPSGAHDDFAKARDRRRRFFHFFRCK